jgi:regulator of protease activity HflC (stomatin/prohibitin superfamily)
MLPRFEARSHRVQRNQKALLSPWRHGVLAGLALKIPKLDAAQHHACKSPSLRVFLQYDARREEPMDVLSGMVFGFLGWFFVRYVISGIYTVDQNERAVKTVFGRAERLGATTLQDPVSEGLRDEERARYAYPQLRVIPPGGPYFRWPWERIHKVSIATQTVNMALDPEDPTANYGGTMLEAVTKDQLNVGLKGQLRFAVNERNLYAYVFGVKGPVVHVLGYFISILRERIANFEAKSVDEKIGVSINDLRKNLRDLNGLMERECRSSAARYGISLDASLITAIDPPGEVESALAAINTAHNQVSSDISLAQASADQRIVESRRAVEIETLRAQAELEPLRSLAAQLGELKQRGAGALQAYLRNARLPLVNHARALFLEGRR